MLSPWLLSVGLTVLSALEPATTPDLAGYEAVKAAAGRDSSAQVQVALWCESHGLTAERIKHLALAVLRDPKNVTARDLLGLVEYQNKWERPEAVSQKVRSDAELTVRLAEYNARRSRVGKSADDHWKLGLWCEEVGLDAEARAHFATVIRIDPTREAAWKRLGCKKVGNRWITEEQLAAEKAETDAQKKADLHWKPLLTKWHSWLRDKDRTKRERADEMLSTVSDPRAVPMICAIFGGNGLVEQTSAVRLLGQIDAPQASRALAMLAVFSDSAEVRRAATETLRGRDTRDFLGPIIALLRKPVKYEVRSVGGPGMPGALFVAGQLFNVQRLYAPPPLPDIPLFAGEPVSYDQYGLPVVSRYEGASLVTERRYQFSDQELRPGAAGVDYVIHKGMNVRRIVDPSLETTTTWTTKTPVEHSFQIPIGQLMLQYKTAAMVAQQQQLDDIQIVENYNEIVGRMNDRTAQVLRGLTGVDRGENAQSWTAWWVDQLGYVYVPPQSSSQPVPTFVENVPLCYLPPGVATPVMNRAGASTTTASSTTKFEPGFFEHMCFAAGTPVRTRDGLRPIESIQVGDLVLSQDTTTGRLSFNPVLAAFHNKPAATLRLKLGDETVVATGIHRFWKAGLGWAMARDLKVNDVLRTIDGTARVGSVESESVQPVFNLEVGAGQSYFVGNRGVLVHDNSIVQPVSRPFDAELTLTALTSDR